MIEKYLSKDFNIKEKSHEERKDILNDYIKKVLVFEDKIDVEFIVYFGGGCGPQGANPLLNIKF